MKVTFIIGTVVAALALAGVAGASPGNGATVTNHSYCVDASPFAIWCWDVRTVTKLATTPAGNATAVTNGVSASSATFPLFGCTSTKTEPIHVTWLEKDGELHQQSERMSSTTSFGCGGSVWQTCTFALELHYANGETQFQRPDFVCTTP